MSRNQNKDEEPVCVTEKRGTGKGRNRLSKANYFLHIAVPSSNKEKGKHRFKNKLWKFRLPTEQPTKVHTTFCRSISKIVCFDELHKIYICRHILNAAKRFKSRRKVEKLQIFWLEKTRLRPQNPLPRLDLTGGDDRGMDSYMNFIPYFNWIEIKEGWKEGSMRKTRG